MIKHLILTILVTINLLFLSPVLAQENPYRNAVMITKMDTKINLDPSGSATISNTSRIQFNGAEYTHAIGRVSIRMTPRMDGIHERPVTIGNMHKSGTKTQVKYSVYKDLIKEEITLNSPETVRYSYDLKLSDWLTMTPDFSKFDNKTSWSRSSNREKIPMKPVIDYAKNSTIDIVPDNWGNLVILVNKKEVVIISRPFAIDATGKQFDLDFILDKNSKTISIDGDLSGAQYPIVIDPTERVTNGDFETGDFSGWSFSANGDYADNCYYEIVFEDVGLGNYYCGMFIEGGNTESENYIPSSSTQARIYQTIQMSDPVTLHFIREMAPWPVGSSPAVFTVYSGDTSVFSEDCQYSDWSEVVKTLDGIEGAQDLSFEVSTGDDGAMLNLDQISVGLYDFLAPESNFSANPSIGPAPMEVHFSDTSAHVPTSWLWNFGDGGTSTEQNPFHTYESEGTYAVTLTTRNSFGTDIEDKIDFINVSLPQTLTANFSGSPLMGSAPLVIQFTDQSSGSPISWSWDFGDGDNTNATQQNPVHTYNSAGTYTVNLTTTEGIESDTMVRVAYVTVTGGTVDYYIFSDGVSLYHGLDGNLDLPEAALVSQYFYNEMTTGDSRCHEDQYGISYCWEGKSNLLNDETGSKYWSKTELADTNGANSAEFVFHSGHGWKDGIVFGTYNNNKNVTRNEMRFSRAKWIVFDSCEFVNESRQYYWDAVFDGAHIIMGFDTWGTPNRDQGPQFVARMRGESFEGAEPYPVTPIRDAWEATMRDTVNDSTLKGAYVWAQPAQNDHLPGYGTFTEPIKSNGHYVINWTPFVCVSDQMG